MPEQGTREWYVNDPIYTFWCPDGCGMLFYDLKHEEGPVKTARLIERTDTGKDAVTCDACDCLFYIVRD